MTIIDHEEREIGIAFCVAMPATPLQEWIKTKCLEAPERNSPVRPFHWDARDKQVVFVRDRISVMLQGEATVIGQHRSKSLDMPVYRIANDQICVFLRGNFYDWKITVVSRAPILPPRGNESMFRGFNEEPFEDSLSPVYFEGFPRHLVLPPYSETNRSQWSAAARNDHALWAICKLLTDALKNAPG